MLSRGWNLALALLVSAMASAGLADKKIMIAFQGSHDGKILSGRPQWKTANYGIVRKEYNKGNFQQGFADDLASAKLLVFTWLSGNYDAEAVFSDAACQDAIRAFLRNGGTICFDYNGICNEKDSKSHMFLRSVGVDVPGSPTGKGFKIEVPKEIKHSLIETPNNLKASVSGGESAYAWFTGKTSAQQALLVERGAPEHYALIVQDGVLGKGKALFSRIAAPDNALIENLLTYAFGAIEKSQRGPLALGPTTGNPASIDSPTMLSVRSLNPLYLRGAENIAWQMPDWRYRLPLIVREPLGVNRRAMTVSFEREFPEETNPGSFRVLTAGGGEALSQWTRVNDKPNAYRVAFATDILGHETRLCFLYFDQEKKTTPERVTALTSRKDGPLIVLENDYIRAELRTNRPAIAYLAPRGNATGNQFFGAPLASRLGAGFEPPEDFISDSAVMIETGPVREVVEYTGTLPENNVKVKCRFILELGSPCLFYEFAADRSASFRAVVRWYPGAGVGLDDDYFWYPGKEGVRKIGFSTEDVANLLPTAKSDLKEGWYAFEDTATRQVTGEIFDLKRLSGFTPSVYSGCWGYAAFNTWRLSPAGPVRGALAAFSDHSSSLDVRAAYLKFKYPPEIALGDIQRRDGCPTVAQKPRLGEKFLLAWHFDWTTWRYPLCYAYKGETPRMAHDLSANLRDMGFNAVDIWPFWPTVFDRKNDENKTFTSPMLSALSRDGVMAATWPCGFLRPSDEAAKSGMARRWRTVGLDQPSLKTLDYLKFKVFTEQCVEMVAGGPFDFLFLADESTYVIHPGDIPLFRERYGMDPVMKVDPDKLAEPAQHNTVLFQMDAYTEILRGMAAKAKEVNPRITLCDQVNPSSMTALNWGGGNWGAPHDWEKHGEFLDTICMDLYDQPRDTYKYYAKLMRSMFGNQKPVIEYIGCTTPANRVAAAYQFPVMWGVSGIFLFPPRNNETLNFYEEARRSVGYLAFTGLGDLAVKMKPVHYLALFRDRAGMIDAIKKGEWTNMGSAYDARIAKVSFLKNLPSDIVMSRFFNLNTLKDYPALFVAEDPAIDDKFATVLEDYVKAGGVAIIEGDTLINPKIQTLCGVRREGVGDIRANGAADKFGYQGKAVKVSPDGAAIAVAFDDGTPAVLERKIGAGTVIYLPFVLSEKIAGQDDIKNFFRDLVARIAGKAPYSVNGELLEEIDTNLLADGKGGYLFCAINPTFETKNVAMTWNAKVVPAEMTDFATGENKPFDGKLVFALPSWQVRFFALGPKGFVAAPKHNVRKDAGMTYSAEPGKNVMPYQLSLEKNTAAKRAKKQSGVSYVAVWSPAVPEKETTGANAIFDALRDKKGLQVEKIETTDPETLAYYDAVIVPNIGYNAKGTRDWEKNIREYGLNGGGVLLCHRTVGYAPCQFPPFPEVGQNAMAGTSPERDIRIVAKHPLTTDLTIRFRYPDDYRNPAFQAQMDATAFKVGDTYRFGFCDYIPLKPGKNGTVIAESLTKTEPTIIAGTAGKGKVVLAGMALGQDEKGKEKMGDGDGKLLLNAVYWLVDKK